MVVFNSTDGWISGYNQNSCNIFRRHFLGIAYHLQKVYCRIGNFHFYFHSYPSPMVYFFSFKHGKSFLSLIFWLSLPPSAGSRFIMPYLPAFSILSAAVIEAFPNKMIQKYLILIVVLISLVTIGYRSQAN